jgi:hypothetical protein
MTAEIVKSIKPAELRALHSVYVAIHRAHKIAPELFTRSHCTTIITALMGSQAWSWRVVGITHAALQAFMEHDFRHKSKQGITRAHLQPRIETAALLLAPEQPMSEADFIETLLRHDVTVLCARGENRASVPEYIAFANDDASLFVSKKIAWRHTKKEEALLRRLHQGPSGHRREIMASAPSEDAALKSAKIDRKTKGPSTAWNSGKKMTRNGVRVQGKEYQSVWAAFQALGMGEKSGVSRGQHIEFRKKLKKEGIGGKLTFTDPRDDNIKYEFTLLNAPPRS